MEYEYECFTWIKVDHVKELSEKFSAPEMKRKSMVYFRQLF
jgi:hypothetical protein